MNDSGENVGSPQSLSLDERRIVAAWAADCAERVLPIFEAQAPDDDRPRDAIERARAFARGELSAAGEIRRRFVAGRAAQSARTSAGMASARSAAQAAGVAHMAAHGLGAAAYAGKAAGLAHPENTEAVPEETRWQLEQMSAPVKHALRQLPSLGDDAGGPLGSGLLATGTLGAVIRDLQAKLAEA